jgi:hypothetical protein
MKKVSIMAIAATLLLGGCSAPGTGSGTSTAGSVLGNVAGILGNAGTISNVVSSVLGTNNLSKDEIVGTWKYSGPGCAFTSDKTLASAGGEVVASEIKEKLKPTYKQLGLTSSNTQITLNKDNTFSAKIDGKSISGKYTFTESDNKIVFQSLLLNVTGYTKRNGVGGVSFLFESKKLLTLLQTLATMSGNQELQTVGEISKNYNGVRLGFDTKK